MTFELSSIQRMNLFQAFTVKPKITIPKKYPHNRIIYGAPGTGKSFELNKEVIKYFPHEDLFCRVTFHPNYSYGQFVGTYKPVPIYKEAGGRYFKSDMTTEIVGQKEPIISYEFVEGPFLSMLVKALKNKDHNYLLIIEEINRAQASSVFGDVFQLLDRNSKGVSEYSVSFNKDVMNFLEKEGIMEKNIKLPSNLYIWATMNNADQGVQPMDTAFKRRWSFEYFPLDSKANDVDSLEIKLSFLSSEIKWNKFRKVINDRLIEHAKVGEDKLIGPFFLKAHELSDPEVFKNKLLLYLKEDILRHNNSDKLFTKSTFSKIVEEYDTKRNIFVFSEEEFRDDK